jgi:acetoin utilization deacetylase AcuC-like enzyme
VSELLLIEQREGPDAPSFWVIEEGRRVAGQEDGRRVAALRAGLSGDERVRSALADATDDELQGTLEALHEPHYLEALDAVHSSEPLVLRELAEPGVEPDIPVCRSLVAAARESARTAITAAQRLAQGARFTYALGRPPGHHAGPAWLGGYCYLNTAAAAAETLRDLGPVGILDLDIHYPNGTAAIAAGMDGVRLHSLHAWPVKNGPARSARPHSERERLVEFRTAPSEPEYLAALAQAIGSLGREVGALVVSLGYDTIAGDPHGCWDFKPSIFTDVGRLLAGSGLPVCVVQEGGYAISSLTACGRAFARGLLGELTDD